DLGAQGAVRRRMVRVAVDADRLAVLDGDEHRAGVGAVVWTGGADNGRDHLQTMAYPLLRLGATGKLACQEPAMQVIESILADASQVAALRRDIHAHPELCFEEKRTSDLIAEQLTSWGIPIHRGMGTTVIVAILKHGSSKRAVGLRADMDALPITEHNTFDHKSTSAGKMHACGHDGHTAMLLA